MCYAYRWSCCVIGFIVLCISLFAYGVLTTPIDIVGLPNWLFHHKDMFKLLLLSFLNSANDNYFESIGGDSQVGRFLPRQTQTAFTDIDRAEGLRGSNTQPHHPPSSESHRISWTQPRSSFGYRFCHPHHRLRQNHFSQAPIFPHHLLSDEDMT